MVVNKPNQADYYDDENMMTIVDYKTPTSPIDSGQGITSKDVVIDSQVGRTTRVIEDRVFVTERFGPFILSTGTSFEPISYIEGGELVSVEVVTDNPYAQVFLQLDDYKNKEPNGECAAELIQRGRTEYSEKHFYVEDRGPTGGYVMKYHPRRSDTYKDRIKISVSNNIKKSQDLYGFNPNYTSRGGLPSPAALPFLGGGVFDAPGLGEVNFDLLQSGMARPIAFEPYGAPTIFNHDAFNDDLLEVGYEHPYVGRAGKPAITVDEGVADAIHRVVFFPPGVTATSTSGVSAISNRSYPGADGTSMSQQHIMVYATAAESETAASDDLAQIITVTGASNSAMRKLVIRDKGKVYFPGVVTSVTRHNSGTSAFVNYTGSEGNGAYCITVSPGLTFTPDKVVLDNLSTSKRDATRAIGVVNPFDATPTVVVREIIVRRKKQKSVVG